MPGLIATALPVDYNMPSGLEAALVLILVTLGVVKITALLWTRRRKFWALCTVLTGFGLLCLYLVTDPDSLFLSARHGLLTGLRILNLVFYILAGLFAIWMIVDWFRPRT